MLAAAAAAGLTALAVTVAAPAASDDKGGKVERNDGPTPEALISCLEGHGATGIPDADEGAGRALKQWIVDHQGDKSVRGALEACDVYFVDEAKRGGPDGAVRCSAPAPAKAPADAAAAKKRALSARAAAKQE
jgi:hypothetical protein